jgi:photosystem II stability/assembly factor-like uncharacterized protein
MGQDIVLSDSVHIFSSSIPNVDRSTDGGKTWSTQVVGFGGYLGFANSQVGYDAGEALSWPGGRNGMFFAKTTNGGNSWDTIYTGLGTDNASGIAVVDPTTVVIIGDQGSIWRTSDGGSSWQRVSSNGGLDIVIKGATGYITRTSSRGILRTSDTGKTWVLEPSNLYVDLYTPVMCGDTLAACADDSGIILIRSLQLSGVNPSHLDSLSITAFPNPSQSLITLSYSLPVAQTVSLTVFDINGNLMATSINSVPQNAGNQSIPISTASFASGTYFYRFSSQNYSSSGSFIVTQ